MISGNRLSVRGIESYFQVQALIVRSRQAARVDSNGRCYDNYFSCLSSPAITPYLVPGTIYDGVYHIPLGLFSFLHSWNSVGGKNVGDGKHLAESFPKMYRSASAPSWLSSNRAWKTAPGVCDSVIYKITHRRIR